jgi:hypothetical protein
MSRLRIFCQSGCASAWSDRTWSVQCTHCIRVVVQYVSEVFSGDRLESEKETKSPPQSPRESNLTVTEETFRGPVHGLLAVILLAPQTAHSANP